jgi:sugar lactone lactonase YvrE
VERYDVGARQLLSRFSVGVNLNGADITPDGQYLYVAESQVGATEGFVRKVNLDDGTVTNLAYTRAGAEQGVRDLSIAANGKAFFTTNYSGSGATVPLHQIDLATDTLSTRVNITPSASLRRGADGSLLFGIEPLASQGPIFTYDSASDTFHNGNAAPGFNNSLSAVNRDGSLIAMVYAGGISIMDRAFHTVQILSSSVAGGGVAFDPNYDTLYAASTATNEVIALDTGSWQELYRVSVGETVRGGSPFDTGEMAVRADSSVLFLSTASGVRVIDLPAVTGVAARLDVSGFPSLISAGASGTFTVTVKDPAGYVIPGFTGTVHFSSTDPNATLPTEYTFTADDQGSHTFTAAFTGNGTYTLTATDDADGLSGSQKNIQTHTAALAVIPVRNRRALVWDASRQLLYITTSDGYVQRYDPTSQALLAPFWVGASPSGMDITADGQYLYVADSQTGTTQGLVRKVNLDDGTVTNLAYNRNGAELAPQDLAIAANGKAFFTTNYSGSGATVPLHQIDLATDTLSTRQNIFPSAFLRRGADGSLLFGVEPTASKGPIFTYDSASDSFTTKQIGGFHFDGLSAVNRDGTLIAMKYGGAVSVLNRDLTTVQILSSVAMAFDPNADILYAASSTSNEIVAYDSKSWKELYRVGIGESLSGTTPFGNGEMQVSDDSSLLFVSTPSGVRVLTLGSPAPAPLGPSSPPGTTAIRSLARGSDLDILFSLLGVPALPLPTEVNGASRIQSGSRVSEKGVGSFAARVDLLLVMPLQGHNAPSIPDNPPLPGGNVFDESSALLFREWIQPAWDWGRG